MSVDIPMPRPQRLSSSPKQILPPRLQGFHKAKKQITEKDYRKRTTAGPHLINDNSAGFQLSFHMFYVLKVTPTESMFGKCMNSKAVIVYVRIRLFSYVNQLMLAHVDVK